MVLVFRISVSSLCDYNRLNSSSRSLLALMLISVLALSGIFTFLVLLNPKQVSAQDQEIVNNYEEIKYRLLPKMVMFDLPSKQMIEANRSLVGDDPFKQLLAQADYILQKNLTQLWKKSKYRQVGINTIFFLYHHIIGQTLQNQMACHISIETVREIL